MNEYWPNRKINSIVNTESSSILNYTEKEKMNKSWGERLIDILNRIDTPYVIMVFDDFILESKIDENKINSSIQILESDNKSSVFYLNAACLPSP